MKNKLLRIIWIIAFFAMLGLGVTAVTKGLIVNREYSELEKRKLKSLPDVSKTGVFSKKTNKRLEKALSDHFLWRDGLVSVKTRLDIMSGKNVIDKILISDNKLIEIYDIYDFEDSQIEENIGYLTDFVKMVSAGIGKEHVKCVFVPSKAEIYNELIPEYLKVSQEPEKLSQNVIDKFKERFDCGDDKEDLSGTVVDIEDVLKKHKSEYIYYNTDHHWTTLGAYYAFEKLYQNTGENSGETPGKKPEETRSAYKQIPVCSDFLGTDYNRIHYYDEMDTICKYEIEEADAATMTIDNSGEKEEKGSIYDESALKTADKYNYFMSGNYSCIDIKTGTKNGKVLMLIKDSFANSLIPFLCTKYEYISVIDLRYVNSIATDYVSSGKYKKIDDVLIINNCQKFMQDAHQYNLK